MTAELVEPITAPPRRDPWAGRARWSRLLLILGWVLLVALAVVGGERQSSLRELEQAVAAGDVDEVRISEGLGDEGRGFATVEVHWRRGLIAYSTEVIEARPRSHAPRVDQRDDHVTGVIGRDLATRLQALRPGLEVVTADRTAYSSTVLGWQLPGRWGWLLPLLWVCTLVSLVGSPAPWRATRWAWFWLMGVVAPFGVAAYLLLAGPAPGVPRPADVTRRLTGGWAFLLALLGSAVIDVIVASR